MSDDDSQNQGIQDYDDQFVDPGPESRDSTPSGSETFEVRVCQPDTPSARLVRPIASVTTTSVQPSQEPSTSAATTIGRLSLTAGKFFFLDPYSYRAIQVDLSIKEERSIRGLLSPRVCYQVNRWLTSVIEYHVDNLIGVLYYSIMAGLRFSLNNFMLRFYKFYGVLLAQVTPNTHRILSCFPHIYGHHHLPNSIKLFNYL